jgi:NAD(P)-dependent dehydrogenase (short-subunit alcohol dehydrogenase family)
MLRKIARPWEFRGVSLFLMSDASSFMTDNALIIDGSHTAW